MKQLILAITSLLVLTLSALGQSADITIGVDLSATGPGASLGIPEKNVLAIAPTVMGGHKVRYVFYDDASDTTTAVQNIKRLVSEDKVDVVIGTTITTTALAVMDTLLESKTPMISLAQASAIVSPMDGKRRWVFKTPANDSVYATAIVRHMSQHGVKTVSVIAFDDPYGESNTQAYKELADRMGIQTLAIEKFKRLDTSVTGQVLHAMKGNPDAVYIVASGSPAALPQMTLIDRGYKGKLYQTSGVVNDDFLRVGGKALEGTFVPTSPAIISEQLPNGYPTKAESVRFAKTYGAKFGSPSFFAALMWDALGITNLAVPKALQTAKPGTVEFREALRAAIENTRGYKGASAVFSYSPTDHAGVNQFGTTLSRIENGKWKLVEWASFK